MHRPFLLLIAALLGILLAVPRGYASGYGYVQNVVVQPTIVQTVTLPTPVALFTYSAAPTTAPPVILSPSLLAAQQQREQALAAEVARLRAAVKQLQTEREPRAVAGPPAIPTDEGPPQAIAAPALSREALLVRAAQIATNRCAMCHSGANPRGDVTLFNAVGAFEPNVSWDEIHKAVTRKRKPMPLGQPALSAEEVEVYFALAQPQSAP